MRLFPQSNGTERRVLFRPNRYDTEELGFLRGAIKRDEAIFIDIGANAGIYSLYAASHAGSGSRVVAIDPNKDLLARLRFNEDLWRAQARIRPSVSVETCEVAISDADGAGHLLADTKEGSRSLGESGDRVETRTLCRLLRDLAIARVDILKIDIEGHEDRALIPFLSNAPVQLLPSRIIIEHISCKRWKQDCFASLADKGYDVVGKTRLNTLLQRTNRY
jgi:FkbM family methyltransferase